MNKELEQKVIYYTDELNDEFSTAVITPRKIDEHWRYDGIKGIRAITRFFWLQLIFKPGATLYLKLVYHHKTVNKQVFKQCKKQSFFLYGNHTHDMVDPYIPTLILGNRSNFVIVHPNNVSIPVLGRITPSLGALPLPDNLAATKNFIKSIEKKVKHKKIITIYPEAHIWPYYTKIRPFVDTSLRYPVQYDCPVFCFTNTYQKRKGSKTPQIVTYVDGPFYADKSLSQKEQRKVLRDQIYNTMVERSKNNNVEIIKYIKKEEGANND